MAGKAMSKVSTRIISRRVSASESERPSLLGSSSRLSAACCAVCDCFCCSRRRISSISLPDLTKYLYSLIILINRMRRKAFTILPTRNEPVSVEAISPTIASPVSGLIPNISVTMSLKIFTSTQIDTVATISSQKKNEYLKSSTTQELTRISTVKATREKMSAPSIHTSAFLVVNQRRKSSPKRAKMVTAAMTRVTNLPSKNSRTIYRVGTRS
mmetsp:Transcript_25942/g.32276  ORF Transcript_25942/g.32276 Transcript_25942/m.32276 type:complete len:213 (-) Transcript_25942:70-708(-)